MKNENCRTNTTRNLAIANRLRVNGARNVTTAIFKQAFLTVEELYGIPVVAPPAEGKFQGEIVHWE